MMIGTGLESRDARMKYKEVSVLRYEIGAEAMRKEGKWILKNIPDNNWDREEREGNVAISGYNVLFNSEIITGTMVTQYRYNQGCSQPRRSGGAPAFGGWARGGWVWENVSHPAVRWPW